MVCLWFSFTYLLFENSFLSYLFTPINIGEQLYIVCPDLSRVVWEMVNELIEALFFKDNLRYECGYLQLECGYFLFYYGYMQNADGYLLNTDGYLLNTDVYMLNADCYLINAEGYLLNSDVYLINSDGYLLIDGGYFLYCGGYLLFVVVKYKTTVDCLSTAVCYCCL